MRIQRTWLLVAGVAVLLACSTEAQQQQRRLRVRPRVLQQQQQQQNSAELDSAEEQDNRPQQAIQYYRAQPREEEDPRQLVLVSSEEDYNGQYGAPTPRARADTYRPAVKVTTATPIAARQKVPEVRAPPVQTIRNYNKVNDDGSFTFGYEAADGSFKEETRGTDCVVRGKYGYIDPDGNKREFTYVSGNPCDPNNPDGSEEDEKSEEESNENVPQNYPKRPIAARPTRPIQTTARPTTVFQNNYNSGNYNQEESEEEVQIGQRGRPAARPFANQQPQTVTQRPRVQIVSTTPNTVYHTPTQTVPVNITPKPIYRLPAQNSLQTQPPPTTYRPDTTTASGYYSTTKANTLLGGTRQPLDFDAEFQKFQQDNKVPSTTPAKPISSSTPKQVTNNPIYQSQLVYDPQTGQYDTALYQQLPQSEGDFRLNHRIQPYVHNPVQHQQSQLVSLDQLQQQSPLYRTQPQPAPAQVQIPQQLYQKQQNDLQFINSQQLFAQQLELQQNQLRNDRLEAAKKGQHIPQQHRYQASSPQAHRVPQPQQQQYYYIQPQQQSHASGQIDAFLRGHNIQY
ncbi:putative mediator of RNA polymerase II transcription subunit 8 [Ochlerotatus camptorhynchus]|uniref:putative mediator of RNA polymerase II transcription subunit 8 n=1 Tax=Ochlerotatus camptorhynchus TaxID=644619 RepID=UPI0031D61038